MFWPSYESLSCPKENFNTTLTFALHFKTFCLKTADFNKSILTYFNKILLHWLTQLKTLLNKKNTTRIYTKIINFNKIFLVFILFFMYYWLTYYNFSLLLIL